MSEFMSLLKLVKRIRLLYDSSTGRHRFFKILRQQACKKVFVKYAPVYGIHSYTAVRNVILYYYTLCVRVICFIFSFPKNVRSNTAASISSGQKCKRRYARTIFSNYCRIPIPKWRVIYILLWPYYYIYMGYDDV